MALRDPVAVYNAVNIAEAHIVRDALNNAGVDALVIEDLGGRDSDVWTLQQIYTTQVWIEREDIDRVKPVLEEYERTLSRRRDTDFEPAPGSAIVVVCEECGQPTNFPVRHRGSVQKCSHCGAYVDVGDDDEGAAPWVEPIVDEAAEEER
jgi:hypothetical protein